jgi:hypothetical protein
MADARWPMPDGQAMMTAGQWSSVIGHRLSAIGHRSSVIGHRLSALDTLDSIPERISKLENQWKPADRSLPYGHQYFHWPVVMT